MTLRLLDENDLPQLLSIENAVHVAPWPEDVFRRCLQAGYFGWVAEHETQILGFIFVSLQASECHILNICVAPEYQHQGFGRQLLAYALTEVKKKGAGIAFLEVRRSNQHAIALYHQFEFIKIGERKGYYPSLQGAEDALVFAKDLANE